MPRTCTICSSPDRTAIETALANNVSYRVIGSKYRVGSESVRRHATSHIAESIKQSQDAKEEASAINVVQQLKTINLLCWSIVKKARDNGKDGTALFGVDRLLKQLELSAKLLGTLDERPVVNVWVTPEWIQMRMTIIQTLSAYPEAKIAVAGALAALEPEQ